MVRFISNMIILDLSNGKRDEFFRVFFYRCRTSIFILKKGRKRGEKKERKCHACSKKTLITKNGKNGVKTHFHVFEIIHRLFRGICNKVHWESKRRKKNDLFSQNNSEIFLPPPSFTSFAVRKRAKGGPKEGGKKEGKEKKKKRSLTAAVTANVGDRIFKRRCVVVLEGKQRKGEIRVEKYFSKLVKRAITNMEEDV